MSALNEQFGESAWRAFPLHLPGLAGALLLYDHATGFRNPRELVSKPDAFYVVQAVRELFPKDTFTEVTVNGRKYLARRNQFDSKF